MEVIVSVAGSLLEQLCRLTFTPICDRIRNFFQFKSNLKALEKEMGKLMIRKTDVDREIDVADKEGKSPTAEAKGWLDDVNKIDGEITSLKGRGMEDSSNKVVEMLKVVSQLLKEGEGLAARVAADNHLPVPVEHIPGPSIEDQSTASKNLDRIMDLLRDDEVKRIGIWGMGGVGKTTLVQNLNNKLKNTSSKQSFSIVVWATVSKNFDLKTVQRQLADRFELKNSEENTTRMAIHLHQRFEKEKSFLLILDDVWTAINLDELGVPRPDVHKGGKIILTSRSTIVCNQMMTNVNFKVDVLDDKESWELFCKNTGDIARSEPVEQIAKEVAKKCCGLPLAIITVGKSMRHQKNDAVWKDALNSLQRAVPRIIGIEEEVFKSLKWSYDKLQDDLTKCCFLFCCLYPEDYSIDVIELIRFWFAEGLLDEHQSYEEQENRGMAIIESLKDSCLLDRGDREDTVKMHDVVRDVAIWIASSMEDGSKSFIQLGIGLRLFPNDSLKSFRRLSFMNNRITRLPDDVVECPKASTLLLQDNRHLETVPHRFLEGFPVLRTLDLSRTSIKSLPHSLIQLGELRALLLRRCPYLKKLPPLEGLSRLQILDCSGTRFKSLPEGIEKLVNLRQLDLSWNPHLKTIRAGILSSLSNLESLNMECIGYTWGSMKNVKTGQAPFEELLCLERLVVLYIQLWDISLPTSDDFIACIKRLGKFQIKILHPEGWSFETSLKVERNIFDYAFRDEDLVISPYNEFVEFWVPLIKATSLNIRAVIIDQMFENVVNMDHRFGPFASLKILTIERCKLKFGQGIRRDGSQLDLFPNVEHLRLHYVEFLESISDLADYFGLRFSRLRRLCVWQCPHLKYILSIGGSILSLEKLEEIRVDDCKALEELFKCGNSMQTSALDPVVPNLRILGLYNLPSLKTLCRENETRQRLELLHVWDCGLIRRLPLVLENTNTIQEITGEQEWWDQLEWDDNDTKSRLQRYFLPSFSYPMHCIIEPITYLELEDPDSCVVL